MAVDLDEPIIRERIIAAQQSLGQTGANLKIVEPGIMHLTLRFLGEIPQMTVDRIKDAMGELRFQPFIAQFAGIGAFPNLRRISVVWVGITRGQEELNGIFRQLEPRLRKIGLSPDNKGFSPHMTVARVRSGINRDALAKYIESMREHDFWADDRGSGQAEEEHTNPKGANLHNNPRSACLYLT